MNGCSHTWEDNPDGSRKCTACGEYEGNMFMFIPVPYHPGWTVQRVSAGGDMPHWYIFYKGEQLSETQKPATLENALSRLAPAFIKDAEKVLQK